MISESRKDMNIEVSAIATQRLLSESISGMLQECFGLLGETDVAAPGGDSRAAFFDHIGQFRLGQFFGGELRTPEAELPAVNLPDRMAGALNDFPNMIQWYSRAPSGQGHTSL